MIEGFRLRSAHGLLLCRQPNGEIGQAAEDDEAVARLVAVPLSPTGPECAVLVDEAGAGLARIHPEDWTSWCLPMRRLVDPDTGHWALAHPYSGGVMIALPPGEAPGRPRCLLTEVREPFGWETFVPEPAATLEAPTVLRAERAAALAVLAARDGLRAAFGRPAQDVEVLARLVPQREFEAVAAEIMHDEALAAAAFAAAANDPFLVGLRNLLATVPPERKTPRRLGWPRRAMTRTEAAPDLVNDARFAGLSDIAAGGLHVSFAQKLNATARRQRAPHRRICALATARNEGPYLLEWIAYHRAIGIEHVFIYSNDNSDGSDDLLAALARHGVVTWIGNTGARGHVQAKAYGHALGIVPALLDYEWAAVLDLDEFLALRPGLYERVTDFIGNLETRPVDVIALNWCVYWSNGRVEWTPDSTLSRFARHNDASGLGKSIVRPRLFTFSHPHQPASPDPSRMIAVRDSRGRPMAFPRGVMTGPEVPEGCYGGAWINHYFSKSAEEFLWKWSRGRGDGHDMSDFASISDQFIEGFMQHHHGAGLAVPDAVTPHLPATQAGIASLLSLPGVEAAHQAVLERCMRQRQEIRARLGGIERAGLGAGKRAFLELLDERK